MWRSWIKSTFSTQETSSSPFSCCSFKDAENLFADETPPSQPTSKKPSILLRRLRVTNSILQAFSTSPTQLLNPSTTTKPQPSISIPGSEHRVVVYFTSLRVVRPTFENCSTVRSILRGFRIPIDERDLAMDSGFSAELRQILIGEKEVRLPRVFIGGKYVGGAEEIERLHETGELKKLIEGLGSSEEGGRCDVCGGYKFVVCEECKGSQKMYGEKSGFRSCRECNENGLIRCPSCCFPAFHHCWNK